MKDGFELQLHIRTEGWWLPASELELSQRGSQWLEVGQEMAALGFPGCGGILGPFSVPTVSRLGLKTFSSSLSVHL